MSSPSRRIHPGEDEPANRRCAHRVCHAAEGHNGRARPQKSQRCAELLAGRLTRFHAGRFRIGTVRQAPAGELQQAEFSRPADRRAAVLNAELAVHGALVGFHGIERDV
jgi:hypothetical protein